MSALAALAFEGDVYVLVPDVRGIDGVAPEPPLVGTAVRATREAFAAFVGERPWPGLKRVRAVCASCHHVSDHRSLLARCARCGHDEATFLCLAHRWAPTEEEIEEVAAHLAGMARAWWDARADDDALCDRCAHAVPRGAGHLLKTDLLCAECARNTLHVSYEEDPLPFHAVLHAARGAPRDPPSLVEHPKTHVRAALGRAARIYAPREPVPTHDPQAQGDTLKGCFLFGLVGGGAAAWGLSNYDWFTRWHGYAAVTACVLFMIWLGKLVNRSG